MRVAANHVSHRGLDATRTRTDAPAHKAAAHHAENQGRVLRWNQKESGGEPTPRPVNVDRPAEPVPATPVAENQSQLQQALMPLVKRYVHAIAHTLTGGDPRYTDRLTKQLMDWLPPWNNVGQFFKGLRDLPKKFNLNADKVRESLNEQVRDGKMSREEFNKLMAMVDVLMDRGRQRPRPHAKTDGNAPKRAAAGGGGGGGGTKGGIHVDGPNGFLWKPVSDSNGKLAVLLPKGMTGDIASVVLKDANGQVIEKGRMTGVGNGDREHFRFSRPGADYPEGVTVEVQLKDGSVKTYTIDNPGQRYD